ncbi:hypothetical protein B0H11DRAFT_2431788 [Mycena galericulata]|nr:hypothetical protein B0H11DRAFT_2431788 [Mycena galericulata]
MKFSAVFFALVPLVAAVPHALHTAGISARAPATTGNVFVCVDAGFTGDCATFHGDNAECVDFSGSFLNDISAIGPGPASSGSNGFGCTGEELGPVTDPGIADLNVAATVDFNDHLSSFASVIQI